MPIRKIYFQLPEYSKNYQDRSDFLFETNYITEYYSRHIKKDKFTYEKANKLLIYPDSDTLDVKYEELFKSVSCYLPNRYEEISVLNGHDRADKIIDLIVISSMNLDDKMAGFHEAILEITDSFKENGYLNIWEFHARTIKGLGKLILECELNQEKFLLSLVVREKQNEIYRAKILEEKPDSLCYHHKFDKLLIDGEKIIIPDRVGGVCYEIRMEYLKHALNKASQPTPKNGATEL